MIGTKSLYSIQRELGRSLPAITSKLKRLGIYGVKENGGWISGNQLAQAMGITWKTVLHHHEHRGLPFHKEPFTNLRGTELTNNTYLISGDMFWKWAKNNKEHIDFSRMDTETLYPVPDWFQEERDKDRMNRPACTRVGWTEEEDKRLIHYFYSNALTQDDISAKMGRSVGSIRCRLVRLRKKNKQSQI